MLIVLYASYSSLLVTFKGSLIAINVGPLRKQLAGPFLSQSIILPNKNDVKALDYFK